MTSTASRLLKIMLPLAAVAGLSATPALAQKKGGTLTVGVELDIAGFDPLKVGVYDTSPNIAASLFLEHAHPARRRRQAASPASPCRGRLPTTSRPGPSSSGPTSSSQTARRSTPRRWPSTSTARRTPRTTAAAPSTSPISLSVEAKDDLTVVYTLKDPAVNFPALLTRPDQNSTDPFADGDPGQGRRLQPQSRRHRAVRHEVVDGRRPHGAGAQPRLLGQGQALPRPRRAAAAARRPVALRQPGVGRDRRGLGRRVRGRQHRPRAQEQRAAGARLCRLGRRRSRPSTPRCRRSTTCACARRWSWRSTARSCRTRSPTASPSRPATPTARARGSSARTTARCRPIPKKAAELIKEYGKPVKFKMLVTATPRGRANGQVHPAVLEAGRRRHGDRAGRPGDVPAARLPAQVRHHRLAHRRLPRSRRADVRQLLLQEPDQPRQLLQPRARQAPGGVRAPRRTRPSAPRPTARSAACSTRKRPGCGSSRTPTTPWPRPR